MSARFYIIPLVFLLGCSSPEDDGDNATTTPDIGGDSGTTADMAVDVASNNNAPDMGPVDFGPTIYPVLTESEPNTQQDEATPFTQPAVLTGSVNVEGDIFDWWEVDLAGPAILEITIEGGDLGWIEVQTPQASKRGFYGGPGAKREFFVPDANRYQVGILATEDNPQVEYRVVVRSYEVTPIPLTDLTVMGDLDDGKVDVYSWTAPNAGFTIAEVFGQRDPIASGLDSFLFIYDDTLDTYVWNDDAMSGGTKDSRLDFERRGGAEYLIAVDMYEPSDDHRYELRLQAD